MMLVPTSYLGSEAQSHLIRVVLAGCIIHPSIFLVVVGDEEHILLHATDIRILQNQFMVLQLRIQGISVNIW
jgi:hypothetical protein